MFLQSVKKKMFGILQARIKKIMQTDEDVGKVAAAVPVLICILSVHYT
jgi:hypothetical protein